MLFRSARLVEARARRAEGDLVAVAQLARHLRADHRAVQQRAVAASLVDQRPAAVVVLDGGVAAGRP